MNKLVSRLTLVTAVVSSAVAVAQVSMAVPGADDPAGREVHTVVAKDSPSRRCNRNLQVVEELASTYRAPIQLLPSSRAQGLPAS